MNKRRISQIWIYPIKSLAGIRLKKAVVQQKGLQYDRRWMLVDKEGRFLTQREHAEMALFKVTIENDFLIVTKQSQSIRLNLSSEPIGHFIKVKIWDDEVEAAEVAPEYSMWFSEHLCIECKLVFFPENKQRNVDPDFAIMNEQVSLADAYPFLIIGQASLDALNKKLEHTVSMKRFRPNFVFTEGLLAHEEDTWKNFKIGSVAFEGMKPCARCVLTTVDPETGEKGVEPLKTISTYRKQNGKVYFGENLLARMEGEVHEGDAIEILDFKNARI